MKAATVVEILEAARTSPNEAIGVGNAIGGTNVCKEAHYEIRNRLRLRSDPLPQDLDTEWTWFVSKSDKARVYKLEGAYEGQRGVTFRDIAVRFSTHIKAGENQVLAVWMRQEHRLHLLTPALWL